MTEIRQTLRSLWRDRGFTAVAVVMLALGVGATTAIFSVVNSILLKPLPYPTPDRLYMVNEVVPELADEYPVLPANARHVDDWRTGCRVCESLGLFSAGGAALEGEGPAEFLQVLQVSHDFLPALGVAPALGRALLPEDDEPGAAPVIVLSDGLWKRRFGGDPAILGATAAIGGESVTVIGVLPPTFRFRIGSIAGAIAPMPPSFDALVPLRLAYSDIRPTGNMNWGAIARLAPGVSPTLAEQQMDAVLREYGVEREMHGRLTPLAEHIAADAAPGLWLLLGAAGAVMLIVCVNLSSLLLARAQRREREAAVRKALGSGSSRLLGWALREGVALGLLGGALSALVAQWALRGLLLLAPADTPRLDEIALDWAALALAAGLAMAAGIGAALIPALRLAAAPVQAAVRESQGAATPSASRTRALHALVASETALSVALLAVAALLATSLFRLMAVDPGFEREGVLSFRVGVPGAAEERKRFHEDVLRELRRRPGVVSAALTTRLPLEGPSWVDNVHTPEESRDEADARRANFRWVSQHYWTTMGIRLLDGEFPSAGEAAPRVVVSQSMSRALWPNQSAVGKRLRRGGGELMEVAGVAADVRTAGLTDDPTPIVYIPFEAFAPNNVTYVVRTAGDPSAFTPQAREAVAAVNPAVPVRAVRTARQLVNGAIAQQRFQSSLAAGFAALALVLAALGVFGVVSSGAARRRREAGLRMALGASSGAVLRLILSQGMRPVLIGLATGLAGAALLGRAMQSLLFGVSAFDARAYAAAAGTVALASLIACYMPARRAASLAPMDALRQD